MQRAISLAILVVLVVLLAILFYQVMIGFLLPLFLAALLAILFQPLHSRMVHLFRGYDRLAAGVTTTVILLIVLAPLAFIVLRAATEAMAILSRAHGPQFDRQTLDRIVDDVNHRFSLDLSTEGLDPNRVNESAGLVRPGGGQNARLLGEPADQLPGDGAGLVLFPGRRHATDRLGDAAACRWIRNTRSSSSANSSR